MLNAFMVMLSLEILLSTIGWLFGGIPLLLILAFVGVFINALVFLMSGSIMIRALKAKPFNEPDILSMIETLSIDAQVKLPDLMVMNNDVPNALCVGRHKDKATIIITSGLLTLERAEIRAMLGHVIGLIRNRHVFPNTIGAVVGMVFSWPANRGYWALFSINEQRKGNLLWMLPILIFAPLGAIFVKMSVERTMTNRADYTSVMLRNDPKTMASALRKASAFIRNNPMVGPVYASNLFIINPFKRDWFTELFDCHPYIERRIEILEGMRLGSV
ncbi:MAG: M48 family metalloprotease [Candidatus Aenigmatarchaeota archaeon]